MESSVLKHTVQRLKNPKLEALYSIIKTLKTGCIICMMYYGYTKWEKRNERKKLVTKTVETDGNYKFGNNFWYSYTATVPLGDWLEKKKVPAIIIKQQFGFPMSTT